MVGLSTPIDVCRHLARNTEPLVSSVAVAGQAGERPARLTPPAPTDSEFRRERLLQAFVTDPAPVTLLCAPAGSGKTALLASWVERAAGAALAWLSLDRYDDDPGLLWSGVLQALRGTGRFPAEARFHDLVAPHGEVAPAFVDALVAEVAALGEPVWLVLDDVHVLRHPAALDSLALLVRRLGPGFRLVLASRADPPLGLPRLRLEGRLRELRASDLAFTLDETAAFLESQGVSLPETSRRVLQDRTEGWVAGIKIAVLAMQGGEQPVAFVERFGGDDHAVADYLVTEVLASLPDDTRGFLLRTSVCTEVDVGLAQRLTGRADSAAVLEALERDNVFTRQLGRGRATYRYHELLRTFLAAELRRTDGELERELQRTAAGWYEQHGEYLHALERLARAGELDRFVAVADAHGVGALLDGRARRLLSILALLDDRHRSVPVVALLGAAAALALDDLDAADRWLVNVALEALAGGPDRALAGLAATVGAARARYTARVDVALARLEATAAGDTGDADRDLYALIHRGVSRLYLGRYTDGMVDLKRAADIARVTERDAVRVECLSFLAGAFGSQGALPEMREQAERAIGLAEPRGWARSSALAHAYVLVAWSAYLRFDTPTAESNMALAITSLSDHNEPDVELAARSLEAVLAADGAAPFEAMQRYRRTFARLADAQMSPALLAYTLPVLVHICLDLGERAWAREFFEAAIARSPNPGEPTLIRAMLLHDAGNIDAARRELEAITRNEAPCHLETTVVRARLLYAEIESRLGHVTRAQEHVLEALRQAEPLELSRPFLDSDVIRHLLVSGQGRFGHHEAFVRRLTAVPLPTLLERHQEANRLTPAELAVLRELPSLFSLREIAQARSLSVNTVKTHLRAIYRKLGVAGRREAVEVGRGRGLV
jgi:LuxR family transcriptional regulator, maltose regulon positive regulatory protein